MSTNGLADMCPTFIFQVGLLLCRQTRWAGLRCLLQKCCIREQGDVSVCAVVLKLSINLYLTLVAQEPSGGDYPDNSCADGPATDC